jgi:predicted nuclease of restriction endonuclease-like RecB superfamily
MAFPLKDIRVTTRRARGADEDALPQVYPRLLRDGAALAKIGIAVGYFESMVGKERREFEPELLVEFFGDHKLARCIVASLARHYRFRPRLVEQVVTPAALKKLRRAGLEAPRALRLELYDRANEQAGGFLAPEARDGVHGALEKRLGLRRGQLELLLHLDADEHAVLAREGEAPANEQVVAYYNFDVLETLLRRAEQVDLALPLADDEEQALRELCGALDVAAEVKRGARAALVRLRGRQDSMGLWSRHGRRVARAVVGIVRRHRAALMDAAARVALRDKRAVLRLTPDLLDMLLLPEPAGAAEATTAPTQEPVETAVLSDA